MRKFHRLSFRILSAVLTLALLLICSLGCGGDDNPAAPPAVNHAPVVNSVTCSPTTLGSGGGTVTVSVSATDSDGDNLTYSYSATLGTVSGSGPTAVWSVPGTEGSHSVTVQVSDGTANASGQAGVSVQAAVTQITGTLTLQAGVSGDLGNTQVAIYTSIVDWNGYNPASFTAATGSGASASYTISNVPPGTYYLDVWKDIDASFAWSSGDFVGWYGTGALSSPFLSPFTITQGETKVINISGIVPIP